MWPFPTRAFTGCCDAGLAWLTVRALAGDERESIGVGVGARGAAIAALYGVSDDVHQLFVAGRSFEYRDTPGEQRRCALRRVGRRPVG